MGDAQRAGLIKLLEDALDVETLNQLRVAGNSYPGDHLAEERYTGWALVERERLRDLNLRNGAYVNGAQTAYLTLPRDGLIIWAVTDTPATAGG